MFYFSRRITGEKIQWYLDDTEEHVPPHYIQGKIQSNLKSFYPFCKGFLRLHVHAYKQGLVTMP